MGKEKQSVHEAKDILLVEDDALLVDIYSTKLQLNGFEVRVVDNGDKVFAAVRKKKPDLVLLDIVLPHMDGWDILERLNTMDEMKGVPIVILSNLGQKEEVEKGLRLGAAKYLIKAYYTPSEVVKEVIKFVEPL